MPIQLPTLNLPQRCSIQQRPMTMVSADWQLLPQQFFARTTPNVAVELLGKLLVRRCNNGFLVAIISETEAYHQDDPASHSYQHRLSIRNRSMFGPPGYWYVYQIYGIHHCLNIVTEIDGVGAAVLIRSAVVWHGWDVIRELRKLKQPWLTGPGRLMQGLALAKAFDQMPCFTKDADLQIYDIGLQTDLVINTERIGISRAKEVLWRWLVKSWQ